VPSTQSLKTKIWKGGIAMVQAIEKPVALLHKRPIITGLLLIVIFSVLRAGIWQLGKRSFDGQIFQPTLPSAVLFLAVFVILSVGLCGIGLKTATGASWQMLGWRKESFLTIVWRSLTGFILIYVITFAWIVLAIQLTPLPGEVAAAGNAPAGLDPTMLLFKAAWGFLIASWQEENLFRGYLQPHLINKMGHWPGILAQAALFSIAHLGFHLIWWQFVASFLLGLILGWLRGKNRSIIPAFIAHGLSWPLIS
jgi:uncharacterized protein